MYSLNGVIRAIRAFSHTLFAPVDRVFKRLQDDAVWFIDGRKR